MIVDTLKNFHLYLSLNEGFKIVADFIANNDLLSFSEGKHVLNDSGIFVNIQNLSPKTIDDACWESHKKMIDIQIPLETKETIGYIPLDIAFPAPYDETSDISFHSGNVYNTVDIEKGMFAIFFPQDVHAPGIKSHEGRKAVFKLPI